MSAKSPKNYVFGDYPPTEAYTATLQRPVYSHNLAGQTSLSLYTATITFQKKAVFDNFFHLQK
jgi:hypothetical protein